jgi:hypothetical protein
VYIHQIGPDQEGFFKFYESEIMPRLEGAMAGNGRTRRTAKQTSKQSNKRR